MEFCWEENGVERSFPLRDGSSVIGRHPSCHIVLPAKNISKKHVQCLVENGSVTIRDLGSSNGTFVNGERVETCVLQDGDEVRLGGFRLVLRMGGEPMMATAEPIQMAEPIAPGDESDFGNGSPADDDTPADGSFVPQAYVPPEQLQPQVVARDGRMYLRDPRTGREVEIVPRKAGGEAGDVGGYYSEKDAGSKRRNLLLIGGAALLGLMLILAILMSAKKEGTKRPPVFAQNEYDKRVGQAVDALSDGKPTEAAGVLASACELAKDFPLYKDANRLLVVAQAWQKTGKSADDLDWSLLIQELDDLQQHARNEKAKNYGAKNLEKAVALREQKRIADEASKMTDPAAAYKAYQALPKGGLVWRLSAKDIEGMRTAARNGYLKKAQGEREARNWQGAAATYKEAEEFVITPGEKQELAVLQKDLEECQEQEALVNSIEELIQTNTLASLDEAAQKLKGVNPSGFFGPDIKRLASQIERRLARAVHAGLVERAQGLYKNGQGDEAIKVVLANKLTELSDICDRVPKLKAALAKGDAALAQEEYYEARDAWSEVAGIESDTDNAYVKQAEAKLQGLKDRSKEIAEKYNSKGKAALLSGNVGLARSLYLKAVGWDPEIGKAGLEDLEKQAVAVYHHAMELKLNNNLAEAREQFEKVIKMTPDENEYHRRAAKQIIDIDNQKK